jgi:hypothetical protein
VRNGHKLSEFFTCFVVYLRSVALQSIASLILRHPVPAPVGCLDGGTDMCAQLWVSKAQVLGGGEGALELAVVEGRVGSQPGNLVSAWSWSLLGAQRARGTGRCGHPLCLVGAHRRCCSHPSRPSNCTN